MANSISPALQHVEKTLRVLSGSFENNSYKSVFDVIRTSRKQFIAENMSWLGLRGGKAWDLAMGQAQCIRRLFRENQLTRHIRSTIPTTLSGQPIKKRPGVGNIQGLVQDGPSWQNQFAENWQAYCQSGAPEALDSPVSYLTWLYQQATHFEEEILASSTADKVLTLAKRRPDLATLTVDDEAINQQIPTLQLVNEILESSITTVLPDGQSVDVTLAETRYPNLLPYHFPHDQVELSLQNAGLPLEEIIGQTATDWPWFLNSAWTGARSNSTTELASKLAPEQQALLIETDNSAESDLTSFYKTNLGLETTDYTPFEDLNTFTRQLGITVPQVEALVAGRAGGGLVMASPNVVLNNGDAELQIQYGAAFINANEEPAVVLNVFMPSELILSNTTAVNGKYGQGIQTRSVDDSYFYFQPDGNIARAMKGDKSFTLGFWSYRENTTVLPLPYVSNGSDARDPAYSSGFELTSYDNNTDVQFAVIDSVGKNVSNSWHYYIDKGKWFYVALSWDVEKRLADWYTIAENLSVTASTVTLDASGLGDITTAEGFTWAFNIRGDLTRHDSSTEDVINLIYDDITVFNGALTATDINTIVTSGKPIAETDISSFSATCIWPSPFECGLEYLSDARMDRINRMVRLQRWLGLSYEETDLLLSACIHAQGENNSDYSLNAHTLRALGVFRHWQQRYGVSAFEFAAVLDVITPYAISPAVPFFDQVFNSPSLFDAPFAITGADFSYTDLTGDSARTVRQICAGLDITQAQFRVLADRVAAEQGDAEAKTLPLTLAVVSALYRLVMVPRWLGLAFADGAALLSLAGEDDVAWVTLAGVPQLSALTDSQPAGGDILDLLMALEAAAVWAADHKLSWVKNYLALQPETDALVATSATVNFVNGIKQQLPATLLSEQSFAAVPVPAGSAVTSWLAVFPDLIDGNGLVQEVATDDSTIAAMVDADITSAGIAFASDADREQDISALSGIISQARLAQNGIADSALAQMFSIGQSLTPYLLNWAGDSEYRLLSDSLTLNSGAALTDPSQVPATYLTDLFALGQRAGITTAFTLTPATLNVFLAHPDWFGVSDTTLTLTLLYRFSRYGDWLTVTGDEDRVLAYLSWVNGDTPPDSGQAADALALLLAWESSEVADATAALPGGLAKTVPDVDYVLRLQQLSTETGLSVKPLLTTGQLALGSVTETWDAWQSAGESLVAAQSAQQ
ncbi:Tc toxin subunit A [Pseudescherichia vulneris]|uniref:Tc toxin subunit A n=1 Tax=Pseudescherichia vulneris TaxID=566 RepID=UPI001EDEEB73|nr:Tc toxin subunit A [Pseudescherichia vulneris]